MNRKVKHCVCKFSKYNNFKAVKRFSGYYSVLHACVFSWGDKATFVLFGKSRSPNHTAKIHTMNVLVFNEILLHQHCFYYTVALN